jgi:hypothetical protein
VYLLVSLGVVLDSSLVKVQRDSRGRDSANYQCGFWMIPATVLPFE